MCLVSNIYCFCVGVLEQENGFLHNGDESVLEVDELLEYLDVPDQNSATCFC